MKRLRILSLGVVVASAVLVLGSAAVFAQSSSTNYQVNEVYFGSGGDLQDCSASYCAKSSAGELAIGNSASANYQFQGGFNTTDAPVLEVAVNGGTFDLGVLDSATVHSSSASFTVRDYLSSGYVVRVAGSVPSLSGGGHTLAAMSTQAASTPGIEQFGINLVGNTTPSIGANPQQLPDSTFGFGVAQTGYSTTNQYKFVNNDMIASSPKSSGTTLYTMSIIGNISPSTPAGQYGGNLSVIVVPTF